jgi:hypothetical protein
MFFNAGPACLSSSARLWLYLLLIITACVKYYTISFTVRQIISKVQHQQTTTTTNPFQENHVEQRTHNNRHGRNLLMTPHIESQNITDMTIASIESSPNITKYVNVCVVTFVKDDPDILPYWLEYHSAIFGPENIAVIDHDSRHNTTLQVLKEWQQKGIHVIHTNESYQKKGDIVFHTFATHFPGADIFLPLDIDEFIIYFNELRQPIANRTALKEAFVQIYERPEKRCWGMQYLYFSHPWTVNASMETIKFFAPLTRKFHVSKKIIANCAGFIGLDHGNHCPRIRGMRCEFCTAVSNIGMLHYHFRNPMETARRAVVDLVGLKDLPGNATLETITEFKGNLTHVVMNNKPGQHKAKELLRFIEEGPQGLLNVMREVYPTRGKVMNLGTIRELIDKMKTS